MGLIGSLVGGAASIFGGIKASKAMKEVKSNIENQKAANEDWYNRRYNEDATQRGDAQRLLTMTREALRRNNKQVAGASAVTGGTEESVAAAKQSAAQSVADAASQINAQADARKDTIEQQYQANERAYNGQLNEWNTNKANAIKSAALEAGRMAGNLPF